MRLTTACLLLLLTLTGCKESSDQQATNSTQQTSPAQKSADDNVDPDAALLADALQQVQAGTALLVDVRSSEEWDEAHFTVAKHIPVDKINEDAEAAFAEIKKEQTVFIH